AEKVYVNGIDVTVLNTRQLYFDKDGKPVTLSLKDYSRDILQSNFQSLDQFLQTWSNTDKKEAILQELQDQGVPIDELLKAVDRDSDIFDIICHVAFDQKPLTRKERANNVKKRNYFTNYGEKARKVLESLLEKYTDEGISNLESMEVLKVNPIAEYGSPLEIVKSFGGKQQYLDAI